MENTLEQYFRNHLSTTIDFSLRVEEYDGKLKFYIHPDGVNGNTWNFEIKGNFLTSLIN
jgi:hypothetical protein